MKLKHTYVYIALLTFLVGNFSGFLLGVLSTKSVRKYLARQASVEEPADVSRPRTIARERFRLEHPGNWYVDTEQAGYAPDHYFAIDTPGSSFVLITFYDFETNTLDNVESQLDDYRNLVTDGTRTRFTKWGRFEGEGIDLHGKKFGFDGGLRVFSYSSDERSFVILEQYYDEDSSLTKPGFDLIEGSFELID